MGPAGRALALQEVPDAQAIVQVVDLSAAVELHSRVAGAVRLQVTRDRETEFPASMGKVSRRELAAHGITRFEQLAARSERELLDIHGVGPKAIRILREELRARGLTFREE